VTNVSLVQENIQLTSRDNLDHFVVDPPRVSISVRTAERSGTIPPTDAVPSFDAIQKQVLKLAEMFGVSSTTTCR
jgi:hypothetical protein